MKAIIVTAILLGALVPVGPGALGADPAPDIKKDGAFAFPQAQATVLCDEKELRLSAWNDAKYLYVQAVVWDDGNDVILRKGGKTVWGKSVLRIDVDADQKTTPNVDRDYSLSPNPSQRGLWYQIIVSANPFLLTTLKKDSKGRGAMRYVDAGSGKQVRVDSYVITLEELGKKPGEKIRFAYWARSAKPEQTINSVGFKSTDASNTQFHLPLRTFHEITLADRPASLDIAQVPDGHNDKVPATRDAKMPMAGDTPPEVSAKDWINADGAPTLTGLKGKVVLVALWTPTGSGTAQVAETLNKLHEDYGGKGLTVLSFTQDRRPILDSFQRRTKVKFVVGLESTVKTDYGVGRLPHAFLIGKDAKVLWEGDSIDKELDQRIQAALK